MLDYNHPLATDDESRDLDQTVDIPGASEIRADMAPDGKTVDVFLEDMNGDASRYVVGGLQINGTPMSFNETLTLSGTTAEFKWARGAFGAYPALNVHVTEKSSEPML